MIKNNTFDEQAYENSEAISFLRDMISRRPGGERRPEQELAILNIEKAIKDSHHLLIQAGTGVGKSFSVAIPAILSEKRVVYSTATKQLSEQVIRDMELLKKELREQTGKNITYSLLKGRDNYLCLRKLDELQAAEAAQPESGSSLFEDDEIEDTSFSPATDSKFAKLATEYKRAYEWAEETKSGDRSEAPPVSDEVWKGLSSNNAECVGRSACPFGEECFAELARDTARVTQFVVTNHAVTGLDLENEDSALLGEREVFIFDEIHELDNYLSSTWGTTLTDKMIADAIMLVKRAGNKISERNKVSYETTLLDMAEKLEVFSRELDKCEGGLLAENELPMTLEKSLVDIDKDIKRMMVILNSEDENPQTSQAKKTLEEISDSISLIIFQSEENVRWIRVPQHERDNSPVSLNCAPIRIGPRLMEALHKKKATMIGTSATITVGGKFDAAIHDFGLKEKLSEGLVEHRPFNALDAGTPFDYEKQGMLYIPNHKDFASPDWKTRAEHNEAVEATTLRLVKAANGRSLVLLTTTRRVSEVGDYLESYLPKRIKILKQGDMPAAQLIETFINDENSVLVATMGMWHGLNAVGPTCSLVIMDKIPFKPFNDPLSTARQNYVSQQGGNGFMQVYVASANVMLAQGAGRLIRSMSDRGVVAILDTRLRTKSYGSAMLKSLPQMRIFSDEAVVEGALKRLAATYDS